MPNDDAKRVLTVSRTVMPHQNGARVIYCSSLGQYLGEFDVTMTDPTNLVKLAEDFLRWARETSSQIVRTPGLPPEVLAAIEGGLAKR